MLWGMRYKVRITSEQLEELLYLGRHSPVAHIRVKALAVYNAGKGTACYRVAQSLGCERRSIGRWVRGYMSEGVSSFAIKPGRGRHPRANREEVDYFIRQSPTVFGIGRTRWNLSLLGEHVPSLKGMSPTGVSKALRRLGYAYKRGQIAIHSPDPQYWVKRGL